MAISKDELSVDYLYYLYENRFPLPRKGELVDLSDELSQYGKNLFIDNSTISKAIENIKGQLYMKTNEIKVKN